MIVFDLQCRDAGHRFEGWFGSSADFERQQERGLVTCPQCGSPDIGKAVMAPRLTRKGNQIATPTAVPAPAQVPTPSAPAPARAMAAAPLPPEAVAVVQKLHALQTELLKSSRFVSDTFVEDARAMHYGEREQEAIHGQATLEEAKELLEEGIAVAPLPFPVVPPEQAN